MTRVNKSRTRIRYDKEKAKLIREGVANRNDIMQMIRLRNDHGITPSNLADGSGLSRQAVQEHLKLLIYEGRIYKARFGKEMRYFIQSSLINDLELFAQTMADRFMDMIDKALVPPPYEPRLSKSLPAQQPLYRYPDIDFTQTKRHPSLRDYFLKSMYGTTLSESYCKANFPNKKTIERNLFEFANRTGSYIAYIFIESLRPVNESKGLTARKKNERRSILLSKSIPILRLFEKFCLLLYELGIIPISSRKVPQESISEELFEINQSDFRKLTKSFKKIYPRLYNGLENYWFNSRTYYMKRHSLFAENNGCDHMWERCHPYKFRTCYFCRKCHLLAESKITSRRP